MKTSRLWTVAGVTVATILISGCGGGEEEPATAQAQPQQANPQSAGAQKVVDAIGKQVPLPNPRDTSDGCKAKEGATAAGCVSRVTTDAVTVIELADATESARWAKEMGKAGEARQAGRFVLTWNGDQDLTSKDARAQMVTIAKGVK